ncbi:MAG: NAD(P)-dependent oxidoreductase [Spirochaetia bacterium]|nr:NAD(P)-dependent oxidoreductase [Spirochaetota bacterium]MCX8096968.1 NAD(P)-dependent oxidoreductase [Spirochaetota bacterium]MDW8111949.1 NAD(P)-dependent oxidoreductase [Spirochaetia bacterium]
MELNCKRILVIGASGFIGRHLVSRLISDSSLEVFVIQHKSLINIEGVNIIKSSLEKIDKSLLTGFDIIFHLGRLSSSNTLGRIIKSMVGYWANSRIVSILKRITKPPKVVFFSGSLVYGFKDEAFENTSLDPISYHRCYFLQEIPFLKEVIDLPIYIIRLPWVFGNGSWFKMFYVDKLKFGYVPVYIGGDNNMTIISVDDAINMSLWIVGNKPQGIYNLFSNINLKQIELCKRLENYFGLGLRRIGSFELIMKHGFEAYEAFKFSLKLNTLHQDIKNYHFKHSNFDSMFLEYIERVFAKTP